MTAIDKHNFGTLDAMRGVAAICVMCYHFRQHLPSSMEDWPIWRGYVAVDLFFVLSGFVIAFAYDDRLRGGMRTGAFTRLRIIRLMPMIWLGALLGVISMLIREPEHSARTLVFGVANLALIPNLLRLSLPLFPLNTPHWSLFFEMVGNLTYVAAFRFWNRGVLAVVLAVSVIGLIAGAFSHGSLNVGNDGKEFFFGLSRIGYSFFVGIILCRTRRKWIDRVPALPNAIVLLLTVGVLFTPASEALRPFVDLLIVGLVAPILVMLGAATEPKGVEQRIAVILAALSYPLYAIHRPIGHLLPLITRESGLPMAVVLPAAVIGLIMASLLLAQYYDAPVRRWFANRWRMPTSALPPRNLL